MATEKVARIRISNVGLAISNVNSSGIYRVFKTTKLIDENTGTTIPNGSIITKVATSASTNIFSIEGGSSGYTAQFRVTDTSPSGQLNVKYWIASYNSGNANSYKYEGQDGITTFFNNYNTQFDTKEFIFYGQGYTKGNPIKVQVGVNTGGIYADITYIEPAPVITTTLTDSSGFYSLDNPVWDRNRSKVNVYVNTELYGIGTTIQKYIYDYWYGEQLEDGSNINSGEIKNPTSNLVLQDLLVYKDGGELTYSIEVIDSNNQTSNVIQETIASIDYTIPNKIVKFEIQRSSNNEDAENPDPDDAGKYLYATIQLQGDDLALFYADGKIKISFTINQESQDFLLASRKYANSDGNERNDMYYLPLPDMGEIIGKDYTFSLTKADNSIFMGSDTADVSISMAISFGVQIGETEIEWTPISNLTATRIVNATTTVLTIERDGIAFGCELKKPTTTSEDEWDIYSLSDPKFLCDMRTYFKKKVSFKERATFLDGIDSGIVFAKLVYLTGAGIICSNTDSYVEEGSAKTYGWEPITLNNAFTVWNETTDSCQAKRKLDSVSIIGAIKPSTSIAAGSTTLIATLDKRYAPPHRLQFRACLESTSIEGRLVIAPQYASDGTTVTGTTLSFSNKGAAASTSLWISICVNYMV